MTTPTSDKKPTTPTVTPPQTNGAAPKPGTATTAATTAATTTPTDKVDTKTDAKSDTKPEDKNTGTSDGDNTEGGDEDKAANRSKFYVVIGEVREFESVAKAEEFLNSPEAPAKYTILRGRTLQTKQRVSLR